MKENVSWPTQLCSQKRQTPLSKCGRVPVSASFP